MSVACFGYGKQIMGRSVFLVNSEEETAAVPNWLETAVEGVLLGRVGPARFEEDEAAPQVFISIAKFRPEGLRVHRACGPSRKGLLACEIEVGESNVLVRMVALRRHRLA